MLFSKIIKIPHLTLWNTVPLVLVLGLIGISKMADLQWHDTYFVFSLLQMAIVFGVFLSLLGLVYWFFRNQKMNRLLTSTHLLVSIIFCVLSLILGYTNTMIFNSTYYSLLILFFLFAQLLFLVNIGLSLFKRNKK